MESWMLDKSKETPDFTWIPAVQKLRRSRQRVDTILNDLKDDDNMYELQQLNPKGRPNFTQSRREQLHKEWLDLKATTILGEIKDAVTVLKDKSTKVALQEFLSIYSDFRTKEEEIYSHDRETVLLNLKNQLEFLGDTVTGVECNTSESSDSANDALESRQENFESQSVTKNPQTFALDVTTTLKSLEGLKKTHKQTRKAKAQIEGLCACLEFRRMKTETNRVELFKQSVKLSKNLSNMRDALNSKKHESTTEFQNTFVGRKKKLSEARAAYERWKMQEVILSSLVDHRNEILKDIHISIENHPGKVQKEELARQELALESERLSKSQDQFERAMLTMNQLKELVTYMLKYEVLYQSIIRENMEQLMKMFCVFENLETSLRTANDNWSQGPVALSGTTLTTNDRELERRLQATVKRVSTEKKMLANDIRFILFIAQDDCVGKERDGTTIGLSTTLSKDKDFDLSSLDEMRRLVDDFVTIAKRTFLTMYALKRLDVSMGFSCSKLNVLKFDIIHRKTHLESRNDAIMMVSDLDSEHAQNEKEHHCLKTDNTLGAYTNHISKGSSHSHVSQSKSFCPWKSDSNEIAVNLEGISLPRVVTRGREHVPPIVNDKSLGNEVFRRTEKCQHFNGMPLSHTESPRWSDEKSVKVVSSFREYENDVDEEQREQFLLKAQINHEQTALDMARHFRFHDQGLDVLSRPCLPRKFLFYTKGIGVFTDVDGGLVDALGMPFPKIRQCPGIPAELTTMTSKAINQLGRQKR